MLIFALFFIPFYLVRMYVQLRKSQAVLTQAAERAAELLESKRMVDETGRRLKEKKEVTYSKVSSYSLVTHIFIFMLILLFSFFLF